MSYVFTIAWMRRKKGRYAVVLVLQFKEVGRISMLDCVVIYDSFALWVFNSYLLIV